MKPELTTGSVLQLPVGLRCFHNQGLEVTEIKVPVTVIVENTRHIIPFEASGTDAHFEECYIVKARALHEDGSYHPEGALLTFALYGDFRPEFILPAENRVVLRKMLKTFLPPNA